LNLLYRASVILLYRPFLGVADPVNFGPESIPAQAPAVCSQVGYLVEAIRVVALIDCPTFRWRKMSTACFSCTALLLASDIYAMTRLIRFMQQPQCTSTLPFSLSVFPGSLISARSNVLDFKSTDEARSKAGATRLSLCLKALKTTALQSPGIQRSISILKQRLPEPSSRLPSKRSMAFDWWTSSKRPSASSRQNPSVASSVVSLPDNAPVAQTKLADWSQINEPNSFDNLFPQEGNVASPTFGELINNAVCVNADADSSSIWSSELAGLGGM
jgi:hypothetical protein